MPYFTYTCASLHLLNAPDRFLLPHERTCTFPFFTHTTEQFPTSLTTHAHAPARFILQAGTADAYKFNLRGSAPLPHCGPHAQRPSLLSLPDTILLIFSQTVYFRLPRCLATSISAPVVSSGCFGVLEIMQRYAETRVSERKRRVFDIRSPALPVRLCCCAWHRKRSGCPDARDVAVHFDSLNVRSSFTFSFLYFSFGKVWPERWGLHSSLLGTRQHKTLAGHTTVVLNDFSPHLRRQLSAALLEQVQNEAGLRETAGCPAVLLQHDVVAGGIAMLEGTMMQYIDGKWRKRHLQVTRSFAVESRDSKEVFEGGWGCRRDITLTGCQICGEHLSAHLRKVQGKDAFLGLSHRRAVQQHSTVLQRKDTFESRAFLETVRLYRQEKGNYEPGVLEMGSEEEVLSSLVMEEILPCLHYEIFTRLILDQRRLTWIKLQAEVYAQVCAQVRTELKILMKELGQQRPLLEKLVRSDLHQLTALKECITHRITEDMCAKISQCVSCAIVPLLRPTVQEVATPIRDGFAAARKHFLETCDDITGQGCFSQSLHEILSPLCGLGLGSAGASQYLAMLELSARGQAWLKASWGIRGDFWRPVVYQAQSTLQQLLDRAAVMFRHLLSDQNRFFMDPSQLTATLHRVRDQVLKQVDQDLRSIRTRLVLESVVQLSLPALIQRLGWLESSQYQPLVHPDYTPFLHPNIIYHQVLRASLTREIQAVMRDTSPQPCVPVSAEVWFSSSEHIYEQWAPVATCGTAASCLTPQPSALAQVSDENVEGLTGESAHERGAQGGARGVQVG
ncbi:hypothetical protein AAFF_G00199580 [Aldrovandia affinis]|uniref:Niban 1/2/3 domain-containing protein n=1 Tax=Aldrovandia affinis TaxID=143900 RepID=A0AAD7W546_9TELE|nr:hypothetical protein AAFF_G00199580 [Aldrovandia affinis]